MGYIKRSAEKAISILEKMYSAILVTGPRRVGKTTILKNYLPELELLNFDDIRLRESIKNAPNSFFKNHTLPLILDEIQRVPEIFLQLKYEIDKTNDKKLVYMSGSQAFHLMQNVSESLAGRIGIIQLSGLSQREKFSIDLNDEFLPTEEYYKKRKGININYENIWQSVLDGGSPELFTNKDFSREIYWSNYINTYIEKDVKELSQIGDSLKFHKFMVLLAAQVGSLLNLSNISKDLGLSVPTCEKYLSILKASHIIYLLEPYSNYMSKRLVKTPKVYFMDTGLICHLLGWENTKVLRNGAMAGHIFENYVIVEIIKSYYNNGNNNPQLYFYRDNDQKEIDLLIHKNGVIYPIEIKTHADPQLNDIKNFNCLKKFTNVKIGEGAIISFYEDILNIAPNVVNIPINYI